MFRNFYRNFIFVFIFLFSLINYVLSDILELSVEKHDTAKKYKNYIIYLDEYIMEKNKNSEYLVIYIKPDDSYGKYSNPDIYVSLVNYKLNICRPKTTQILFLTLNGILRISEKTY